MNRQEDYRLGSVGKALPRTDLKIAEDGEILVRGPIVFKGYLNQPDLSAATITEDGWIQTGDLGHLDQEGFLWITGRKKEIIITAGGKNITPANIENLLKDHPLIDQALVHGDRRKYLTALLGLDPENLKGWAAENGIAYTSYEEILESPALRAEVQQIVDEVNQHFARYETIKCFALLPRLLEVEKGELTPTLKIRRRIIEERFKDLLDSLYHE
jgi:long-chain acyl-CoA synthetase